MIVALYARVSTRNQEKQGTIGSQIEVLRTYAKAQGVEIIEDYVCKDEGYSGALLARPGLDRLRDGAQAGAFDGILVLTPDRLSRKYAYLILILEAFERYGVKVTFLEQPPADDPHSALLVQIQGDVAAHLVVDEAQADVVKRIFAWHADEGMSIRQIAKRLTGEGYSPPRGGPHWGETTVHHILTREAYLGTLTYNLTMWTTVPATGGKRARKKKGLRPQSEHIPISIPPLIDRERFDRSQARHGFNQQFSPRNLHQTRWLLRRLVRCEQCGLKCVCVSPNGAPSYRCGKQLPVTNRVPCRPKHIRAEPLDELVWQAVRRHLLKPQLLAKAQTALSERESLDQTLLSTQLTRTRKRLTQVNAERRRLLDMYQGGFI